MATADSKALLGWLTVGLIAVGVIGRLVRYFLQFPIWGDEAFICFNLLDRDFAGLTRSLEYGQVAPVLFLWVELVFTRLLGISELAMRLPPFLAGLAALGLFWRLASSILSPLAVLFAVGLLAAARWPITMRVASAWPCCRRRGDHAGQVAHSSSPTTSSLR